MRVGTQYAVPLVLCTSAVSTHYAVTVRCFVRVPLVLSTRCSEPVRAGGCIENKRLLHLSPPPSSDPNAQARNCCLRHIRCHARHMHGMLRLRPVFTDDIRAAKGGVPAEEVPQRSSQSPSVLLPQRSVAASVQLTGVSNPSGATLAWTT